MKHMLESRLLTCMLGLIALGLGGYLYVAASNFNPVAGTGAGELEAAVASSKTKADAVELEAGQAGTHAYMAIVDRPLFAATRRPPQARPQPVAAAPAPAPIKASAPAPKREIKTGQFALIGVVIENGSKRALLRQGRSGEVLRVVEDDVIDGWRAERIEPHAVHFVQDGVVDIVLLRDNQAPARQRPPARATREARAKADAKPTNAEPSQAKPPRHSLDRLKPNFKHNERQASLGRRVEARLVPVMVRVAGAER